MLTHLKNIFALYNYLERIFEEKSINVGYSHLLFNVIKVNILRPDARIFINRFALKGIKSKFKVADNFMDG